MASVRVAGCAIVLSMAGSSAIGQVVLPLGDYGRLNQRAVDDPAGIAPGFGMWACGPTSVVNSLAYLENTFPGHYQRKLVPEIDGVPGVTWMDLRAVAMELASAAFMDTRAPGPPDGTDAAVDNYEKDVHGLGPGQVGGRTGGGTTFSNFAWGKDAYLNRDGIPKTEIDGIYKDAYRRAPGQEDRAKPAWLRDLQAIPGTFITQAIDDAKDLEIGFTWQFGDRVPEQGNNDAQGGHFVTVYGWEINNDNGDDANNNGVFEIGETVTLKIIDPFGPPLPGGENMAPALDAALFWRADGELFIGYAGGAAGAGSIGRLRMAVSEIPAAPTMGALAVAGLVASRRRRR